jgi:exosortase/archaeosortase family protein
LGYKKEKKEKYRKNNSSLLSINIKTRWGQKRPVLFFVLGFSFFMIVFYFLWQSDFFNSHIQPVIVNINARISSGILNLMGQKTTAYFEMIISPLLSISIARGCDAVEAMALFVSTTLAFPMNWKRKIIGLFTGLILLFIINIVRIVSLYFIGIHSKSYFETMHAQVWPVIIIIFATLIWVMIIRNEKRKLVYAEK